VQCKKKKKEGGQGGRGNNGQRGPVRESRQEGDGGARSKIRGAKDELKGAEEKKNPIGGSRKKKTKEQDIERESHGERTNGKETCFTSKPKEESRKKEEQRRSRLRVFGRELSLGGTYHGTPIEHQEKRGSLTGKEEDSQRGGGLEAVRPLRTDCRSRRSPAKELSKKTKERGKGGKSRCSPKNRRRV